MFDIKMNSPCELWFKLDTVWTINVVFGKVSHSGDGLLVPTRHELFVSLGQKVALIYQARPHIKGAIRPNTLSIVQTVPI